jgi:hypothetical protein
VEAPPFEIRRGVVLKMGEPPPLLLPGLAKGCRLPPIDSLFAAAGRLLLPAAFAGRFMAEAAA